MSTHDKSARNIRAFGTGMAILVAMGSLTACAGDPPPTTTTTRTVTTDSVAPAPVPVQQTTTVQRTTTNQ